MSGTTAKGVPYSLGADAASTIDDTMTLLAQWLDARPGIAIVTTAQRNALAAPDLWIGKVVYTTDTVGGARLEVCTGLGPPATWRGVTVSALVTDAQRDAFGATDVWPGRTIFNTTSNTLQIYTGAAWQVVGSNIPTFTDAQRDALAGDDRWTGLLIWNSTSSTFQIWNGTTWQLGTDITPTMTTAARTALAGDDLWLGRMVFDTNQEDFYVWDGAAWRAAISLTAAQIEALFTANQQIFMGTGSGTGELIGLLAAMEGLFTAADQVFHGTGAGAGELKTVAAIIASYFSAAGQLWAGTGSGSAEVLAAPVTAGTVLQKGGADPSGLEWAVPALQTAEAVLGSDMAISSGFSGVLSLDLGVGLWLVNFQGAATTVGEWDLYNISGAMTYNGGSSGIGALGGAIAFDPFNNQQFSSVAGSALVNVTAAGTLYFGAYFGSVTTVRHQIAGYFIAPVTCLTAVRIG